MANEVISTSSSLGKYAPSTRIFCAFVFAVVTALLPSIPAALTALFLSLLILIWAKPAKGYVLKRWCAVNIFIVFLWLFTPWATPDTPISEGSFITYEGLVLCALITLKTNALFFVFVSLVSTMSFSSLSSGLAYLRFPTKLSALLLLSARAIDIFEMQYKKMVEAAELRGFVYHADIKTYKSVAAFIAILISRAFRQSRIMQEAMMLRGFDGTFRTLQTNQPTVTDFYLISVFVFAALVLGLLGWII